MNKMLWLAAFFLACGGKLQTIEEDEVEEEPEDEVCTAPDIDHDPIEGTQRSDVDVAIAASVTVPEDCEVLVVEVHYAARSNLAWEEQRLVLSPVSNQYEGWIPGAAIQTGEMVYYLTAVDKEDNATMMPDGADDNIFEAWTFGVE